MSMAVLGVPSWMNEGFLPTLLKIYNHYLKVKQEKEDSGEWTHNISNNTVIKVICSDIKDVWDRTQIPNILTAQMRKSQKKVSDIIHKTKNLMKKSPKKRGENFGNELNYLVDFSKCLHESSIDCNCSPSEKVPFAWQDFLRDQRGLRVQMTRLTRNTLSLRTADTLELSAREKEAIEKENKKEARKARESNKSYEEKSQTVPILSETLIENSDDEMEIDISEESDDDFEKAPEYNTLKLKNFARECDRYKTSNRAGAKLAYALMKDLGIVTKDNNSKLICLLNFGEKEANGVKV